MKTLLFSHSLVSDWNHGNAHFLRGVVSELLARGHETIAFEPTNAWSLRNLLHDHGDESVSRFHMAYPHLRIRRYDLETIDLEDVLDGVDLVIVHEWNDHELVRRLGEMRARGGTFRLLFHDTHHRCVTDPGGMAAYDLLHYDGVLAFGEVIRDLYLSQGWVRRAWTWHEAADTRVFKPMSRDTIEGDVVWIGNWGDGERTAELHEFLFQPIKALNLRARVFGVRYPDEGRAALAETSIDYAGWLPNYEVPNVFARFRLTVHIPRRPYATALPGIPTIRPFEALACNIPLVCTPWNDVEGLFRPGYDFLVARNGAEIKKHMRDVIHDQAFARDLANHGRRTVLKRHTCAHRVDELLEIAREIGVDTRPDSIPTSTCPPWPMSTPPVEGNRSETLDTLMHPAMNRKNGLEIAFFGSSLVSAYWNGAATYYRGIIRALHERGHRVTFYEPDAFDRQKHRDLTDLDWARVVVYPADLQGVEGALEEARSADAIVKASGVGVFDEFLEAAVLERISPNGLAIYWDVDAPSTLDQLRRSPSDPFHSLIPRYDLILTYGGGEPVVQEYTRLGARVCVPIYNALDPSTHHPVASDPRFVADLTFLGNRLPDREARVEEFFLKAAALTPTRRFLLGGSGWSDRTKPANVDYVGHVFTADHNALNASALAVMNISRESMARFGFSPATRVFEAAGASACIITDVWDGIEQFFEPGKEILVARDGNEVASLVQSLSPEQAEIIGERARSRALAEHTYSHRAEHVEVLLNNGLMIRKRERR